MEPPKLVLHHVGVSQRGTIMAALSPNDRGEATRFEEYVRTAPFAPFMREVLHVIEEEQPLKDHNNLNTYKLLRVNYTLDA